MNSEVLRSKVKQNSIAAASATAPAKIDLFHGVYRRIGKRIFDIVVVLLMLPLAAPLIFLFWLITRRDGGVGLFGHLRVGQNGRYFKCWKLRTMVVDAEERLAHHLAQYPAARAEWEASFKLHTDPRITQFGNFLRKSSLDELPQLWNVLLGEMSLVGPRPVVPEELPRYGVSQPAYLACQPGLTGIWQVSGRNAVSYAERVEMDVQYAKKVTFLIDLKIVLRTALVVVKVTGK